MVVEPDELDPRRQASKPKSLDGYSVEELRVYVQSLKEEIQRAEAAIGAKTAHRSVADALFRVPK